MSNIDISIIIPTYNRLEVLKESLKAWKKVKKATSYKFEIIYADGSSTDGTSELLQSVKDLPLVAINGGKTGLSYRRNLAINASNGKRLLFVGDDIFPTDDFIDQHIEIGKKIGKQHAVLGNISWHPKLPTNQLLKHIVEVGCEQFDFEHLESNSFTNFQHFYTANVSIDRATLYSEDYFFDESFPEPNYEDIELAFRLSKRGMLVFYSTAIQCYHYHHYSTAGFCKRQFSAGKMSTHFRRLQPGVDQILGINKLEKHFVLFCKKQLDTFSYVVVPSISQILTIVGKYEILLESNNKSFLLQRTLSDYYIRLFQLMYEKGVLEELGYNNKLIDSFLIYKWFSYDTLLTNQQFDVEINENNHIPMEEKKLLFSDWSKINTKTKPESDLRQLWWRHKQINSLLGKYYSKYQGLKQKFYIYKISLIINQINQIVNKIKKKLTVLWFKLYFLYFLNPEKSNQSINIIISQKPTKNILERFFSQLDTHKVFLILKQEHKYFRITSTDSLLAISEDATRQSAYSWKIDGTIQDIHLNVLYTILLALSFLNLDYVVLEKEPVDGGVITEIASQSIIVRGDHALSSVSSLVLGKILFVPYLASNQKKITLDNPLNTIEQNYLVGKNFKLAQQKLNWNLIRSVGDGFIYFQKTKPVVFVFPTFLAVGGVEKNTLAIIKELQSDFDFVVINFEPLQPSQGSLHKEFIPYVKAIYELGNVIPPEIYIKTLEYLQNSYMPNLVWICNGSPWLSQNLEIIRNLFSSIAIVDQQVYDTTEGWISEYSKDSIKKFDRFIATNKKIARVFREKFHLNSEKIDLIYPALDSARVEQVDHKKISKISILKKYNLPRNKRIITFIGRITDQKRPLWFLQLAKHFKHVSDLQFVMIGDGDLRNEVEKMIIKDKLTNVTRISYTDNPNEVLRVTSALIIVSKYEGLPISLLEALAIGVPFFSTDVGGIRDLQEEYCSGYITNSKDINQIQKEVGVFIRQIDEFKNNAKKYKFDVLNRFKSETVANQYKECFIKAMNNYANEE